MKIYRYITAPNLWFIRIMHVANDCYIVNRFNPLPTVVANMIHIDPLFFVCTLQPNRPTHGDVPRQGDKTCFFAKKCVCFRAASPTKSIKSAPKWRRNLYFFPFFKKVTFCHFFDFLPPCDLLGAVWTTPRGSSLPKICQVPV